MGEIQIWNSCILINANFSPHFINNRFIYTITKTGIDAHERYQMQFW